MGILISASILGADLANISDEIKKVSSAGADYIHFDVMDGVFVDNISFGLPVLSAVKKISDKSLDVHLMICNPEKYIERFCRSGADMLSFHIEATTCPEKCIQMCREHNVKVGITIKPNTPVCDVYKYLNHVDFVLIMTVEPGFGGQGFIYAMLEKIKQLHDEILNQKLDVKIEVDGGITNETAHLVIENGAEILVSGSYLFNSSNMESSINLLRG